MFFKTKLIVFKTKTMLFEVHVAKFSPAAGPLPGVALSGEQPLAARCAGAKSREKFAQVFDFVVVCFFVF